MDALGVVANPLACDLNCDLYPARMGRSRRPVTYIKRATASGKPVWYYRFVDAEGARKTRSTGQTSRAAAENFVAELLKADRLHEPADMTFGSFAQDWWVWDRCDYV